jgi:hypothetical protein
MVAISPLCRSKTRWRTSATPATFPREGASLDTFTGHSIPGGREEAHTNRLSQPPPMHVRSLDWLPLTTKAFVGNKV